MWQDTQMSAAAALPAPLPLRDPRSGPAGVTLPFPHSAPGETALLGLGTWDSYRTVDKASGSRELRVRFHRGLIEIMSISFTHESLKKFLSMLVEAWCDETALDLVAWGSATLRIDGIMGGEPDEAYNFGPLKKDRPDLIIEVALSTGGIDKLGFWAELEIPEVWIWQNGALSVFAFESKNYVPISASRSGLTHENYQI